MTMMEQRELEAKEAAALKQAAREAKVAQVYKLGREGLRSDAIAERTGFSVNRVRELLKRARISRAGTRLPFGTP